MVIKNSHDKPVEIHLASRVIVVHPGEEVPVSAEEVKDPVLRESLQEREISIVRPTTEAEEDVLQRLYQDEE
jgi:hypothetical protein